MTFVLTTAERDRGEAVYNNEGEPSGRTPAEKRATSPDVLFRALVVLTGCTGRMRIVDSDRLSADSGVA